MDNQISIKGILGGGVGVLNFSQQQMCRQGVDRTLLFTLQPVVTVLKSWTFCWTSEQTGGVGTLRGKTPPASGPEPPPRSLQDPGFPAVPVTVAASSLCSQHRD